MSRKKSKIKRTRIQYMIYSNVLDPIVLKTHISKDGFLHLQFYIKCIIRMEGAHGHFSISLYGIHHPHFFHIVPILCRPHVFRTRDPHKLLFLCYFLCVDVTHSISLIQLHIHFQSIFLSCLSLMFYTPGTAGVV